ncbi:MAG: tetratricopeptide repeat protein [Nannocystaceae bacterium]
MMEAGDLRGAEAVIDDALQQHKDDHELWFSKGVVRQAAGDDDGAVQAWTKALELQPQFVPGIFIGSILLGKGDFDAAIDRFSEALRLQPDYADAHYNLGLALLGAKQRQGHRRAAARGQARARRPRDPGPARGSVRHRRSSRTRSRCSSTRPRSRPRIRPCAWCGATRW